MFFFQRKANSITGSNKVRDIVTSNHIKDGSVLRLKRLLSMIGKVLKLSLNIF